MDDYNDLVRQQTSYKEKRENKYKCESRDRLAKILKKKVETTMIGALSSVEENFSFLWEVDKDEMTPEQHMMHDLYQKVRSEILDKATLPGRDDVGALRLRHIVVKNQGPQAGHFMLNIEADAERTAHAEGVVPDLDVWVYMARGQA